MAKSAEHVDGWVGEVRYKVALVAIVDAFRQVTTRGTLPCLPCLQEEEPVVSSSCAFSPFCHFHNLKEDKAMVCHSRPVGFQDARWSWTI